MNRQVSPYTANRGANALEDTMPVIRVFDYVVGLPAGGPDFLDQYNGDAFVVLAVDQPVAMSWGDAGQNNSLVVRPGFKFDRKFRGIAFTPLWGKLTPNGRPNPVIRFGVVRASDFDATAYNGGISMTMPCEVTTASTTLGGAFEIPVAGMGGFTVSVKGNLIATGTGLTPFSGIALFRWRELIGNGSTQVVNIATPFSVPSGNALPALFQSTEYREVFSFEGSSTVLGAKLAIELPVHQNAVALLVDAPFTPPTPLTTLIVRAIATFK